MLSVRFRILQLRCKLGSNYIGYYGIGEGDKQTGAENLYLIIPMKLRALKSVFSVLTFSSSFELACVLGGPPCLLLV